MGSRSYDVIVVGGGHNGLVAAAMLARAGRRVAVLERSERVGGAAVSENPFPGLAARLSRYSYLVSLFPRWLLDELGVRVELRRRRVSSYTPVGTAGVLVADDLASTRASLERSTGNHRALTELTAFGELTGRLAERTFGSLTEPLRSRDDFRALVGEARTWEAVFERPLSALLEASFTDDVVRGIVATDALIGTFARLDDPQLPQNRCFLYHVIGNGTGRWDVPVGGMGSITAGLAEAVAQTSGTVLCAVPVRAVDGDERRVSVRTAGGDVYEADHLVWGAAPTGLADALGEAAPRVRPEGSQLKLNLLLRRLPRLRDPAVAPEDAFAGTFHIHEGYTELATAYAEAAEGQMPSLPPCEAYCHSLTDPTILGPELRAAGAHTLTVFALHMPARLFTENSVAAKQAAVAATLRSINSVLAEPIEECLLETPDGEPCLEARTPVELETELALPGGHIFHRDLSWPFAESEAEAGTWGVETPRPNVWLCGAGARRGGGVSGIPGYNAARAVLAAGAVSR